MRRPLIALVSLLALAACRAAAPVTTPAPAPTRLPTVPALVAAPPAAVGMAPSLGRELDSLAAAALADSMAPGVAIAVGRWGRLVHMRGYGRLDWPAESPAVDSATPYDLASLTKVVATTTLAMMLEEEGRLDLDRTVASYLVPQFAAPDKAGITVRMLLTHTGGLEAGAPLYRQGVRGREQYLAQIEQRPLRGAPGAHMVYSDWDIILLQSVVERITGRPLDSLFAERVAGPLGLRETRFLPDAALRPRVAPTAVDTARGGLLQGVVHDGNAWAIGGVSGHAGLFGSARDLARFAQMLLNNGSFAGTRLLAPATVARWTAVQDELSSRALGWDSPSGESSAGRYASPRAYGHTGFTGTSMWMDPERGLFIVILANRVHSRGTSSRHVQLRRDVADAVLRGVLDAPLVERPTVPPRTP
ncbi:MAG TPA: serine hydrolase domain-containing protein [Gemmatimonadaceae bacterium]|nr:serine hydrolase domain-containing protein [Gemmatimonadaceae bacterium]